MMNHTVPTRVLVLFYRGKESLVTTFNIWNIATLIFNVLHYLIEISTKSNGT